MISIFSKEIFAERLTMLLQSTNTSKQALADNIGVSRQSASQFANGNNLPSIETLVRIAKHFEVSTDYLLGLSDK